MSKIKNELKFKYYKQGSKRNIIKLGWQKLDQNTIKYCGINLDLPDEITLITLEYVEKTSDK